MGDIYTFSRAKSMCLSMSLLIIRLLHRYVHISSNQRDNKRVNIDDYYFQLASLFHPYNSNNLKKKSFVYSTGKACEAAHIDNSRMKNVTHVRINNTSCMHARTRILGNTKLT